MALRWLIASLHLLTLPLGLGAIWARSRALQRAQSDLHHVFLADNLWALAAVLWISTGLLRAFGGLEKGAAYYLHDRAFYVKMGLLVTILVLEVWPMITLMRWRIAERRKASPDLTAAPILVLISRIQAVIVILMVFAATAMARGFFH